MADNSRVKLGEKDPQHKSAWNPENSGYGKHSYRHVDPDEVNPEEYARAMRGEEQHYGDVREYNCAANEKHPENTASLDWLGRIGTVFSTDAPGHEGNWLVVDLPRTASPKVYVVAVPLGKADFADPKTYGRLLGFAVRTDEWQQIPSDELGIVVDEKNEYKQVVTKILKQGKISRNMRTEVQKRIAS